MSIETNNFIFLGNNFKILDDYCFNPYMERDNQDQWKDITKQISLEFEFNHKNEKFSDLTSDEKIHHIQKKLGNIRIIQNIFDPLGSFSQNDQAIFVDKNNEFVGLYQYIIKPFLYSNFSLCNDSGSFPISDKVWKNKVKKSEINWDISSKENAIYALNNYNTYHLIKNKSDKLNLSNQSDLIEYLLDHHGDIFDAAEDFDLYELNIDDFISYSSVYSFLPDFYFDLKGTPIMIYHLDKKIYLENIKTFIDYIKELPPQTLLSLYDYTE